MFYSYSHALVMNTKIKITFRVTNDSEPDSLDPQLATSVQAFNILINTFLGLTVRDAQTGGYKPGLAHSWDISDDGLIYFLFKRGARLE